MHDLFGSWDAAAAEAGVEFDLDTFTSQWLLKAGPDTLSWDPAKMVVNRTAPSLLAPTADHLHDLADALGDAHNLTVLMDLVLESPARFGGPPAAERIAKMAGESRADLEDRAIRLGRRLYAEAPKAFARRLRAYWKAGQLGDELPTGELADIGDRASTK